MSEGNRARTATENGSEPLPPSSGRRVTLPARDGEPPAQMVERHTMACVHEALHRRIDYLQRQYASAVRRGSRAIYGRLRLRLSKQRAMSVRHPHAQVLVGALTACSHIHGTDVPVEEPSTASTGDIALAASCCAILTPE